MTNGEMVSQDPYEAVLADLRAQRAKIDQTIENIESLRSTFGRAAQTPPVAAGGASGSPPVEGEFLGMTIADAAVQLLNRRRKALPNSEILKAFKEGGLVLTSADPMNVINSVLTRRFNQVGDIVRVDRGVWGLQQWYPNRNFKKKAPAGAPADDAAEDDKNTPPSPSKGTTASVPFMITQAQRDKLRQYGASEEDIKNMTPAEAQSYLEMFS